MFFCALDRNPLDKEKIMAVNDVFQLDIVGSSAGEYCENILHFKQTVVGTVTTQQLLAYQIIDEWQSVVQAAWLACMPTDYDLTGFRCKRVWPIGGNTAYQALSEIFGEYDATTVASSVNAMLLCGYQDTSSLKFRVGRCFLPGAPESAIAGNAPTSGYLTLLASLASLMNGDLTNTAIGTVWPGIWSPLHHVFYQVNAAPTGQWQVGGKLGTQRRRLKPAL